MEKCSNCKGDGIAKCWRCDGYGTMQNGDTCYYCKGRGIITCESCGGTGQKKN